VNGVAKFALFGAISGALYGLWNFGFLETVEFGELWLTNSIEEISHRAGAGLFYGVIVGAMLRRPLGLAVSAWLIFILAAALSYYGAFAVTVQIYDRQSELIATLAGGAGGVAGALLLGSATAILSPSARSARFFVMTTIAGGLFGLLLPVALNADLLAVWIAFFALWQAGYAAATAASLRLD